VTPLRILQIRTAARTALAAAGFRGREADGARLHLERLPSADEVRPVLDPLADAGEQLALLDLAWWEAARCWLNLQRSRPTIGNEEKLHYRGLALRRSAAG
jgi:hypothetical protein